MPEAAQSGLLPAREVARSTPLVTAANGLPYASFGYTEVPADSLKQIVEAVPPAVAAALAGHAYYFVPLAIGETGDAGDTEIARGFTNDLGDRATCHRNLVTDGVECTFISARLMQDRFALAFEFFINIGHQLVDAAGVPRRFQELVWAQARAGVRGETSQDAYEARVRALELSGPATFSETLANSNGGPLARSERGAALSLFASRDTQSPQNLRSRAFKSRAEGSIAESPRSPAEAPGAPPEAESITSTSEEQDAFFEAAFADTMAIYMLSLAMDLDYADLREREYPLLAAPALADRLRLASELFPPAASYEFAIRYRRRH
jgi:hypothetical protein